MIFCAESTLLVCKKDSFPQPQIPVPDGKPVTAPVPKSQGTHYPSFSSQFIIRMHYETELLWLIFVHPLKHIFLIFKQLFKQHYIHIFTHFFTDAYFQLCLQSLSACHKHPYMFHSFVCLDFIYQLLQSQHYFPKMVF